MDHPDSFGWTDKITGIRHGEPRQGWGKRKAPQVSAVQERQHQLFLTVTSIFEEIEYEIPDYGRGDVHIVGLGSYRKRVTKVELKFHENYQFPFDGKMVTVIFDKLSEPKKEPADRSGVIGFLNEVLQWLEPPPNSSLIKNHPF